MSKKSGFTLVELSIVLVIIGLLIGGILVAQSMINTAQIMQQIKQIEEVQVAIRNFKTKFNCLPADCTRIGNYGTQPQRLTPGDGNGMVRSYGSTTVVNGNGGWMAFTVGEWARVFDYLAVTEMYNYKPYDETVITSNAANIGYPQMVLKNGSPYTPADGVIADKGGLVFGWEPENSYITAGHKIKLGMCAGGSTGLASPGTANGPAFFCGPSNADMIALDSKLDDGRPYSGKVYINSDLYQYRIPGGISADVTYRVAVSATNSYRAKWNDGAPAACITQGCYAALTFDTDL